MIYIGKEYFLQLTYTYDNAGNRLTKKYDNDGNRVETYTINGYNQVTAVSGNRGKFINVAGLVDTTNLDNVLVKNLTPDPDTEAASVDIVGNFFIGRKLEMQEGTNSLQATATDKAGNSLVFPAAGSHDVTLNEDVDEEYEYDLLGNMVVKKVDDVVEARYFYNHDNLIEYVWYRSGLHDNLHEHYVYDGLNRRIIVEYGTVTLDQNNNFDDFDEDTTKWYAFAGTVPVIEYDYDSGEETLTVVRQYYWGLGLPGGNGALLYMKVAGDPATYYYYHYDGSCNVTCITDADKEIKALYEYDAFGNIITKCGSLANDFLFSTQMANTSSGLYMYMFRSYSSSLGRWTQRDPIGFRGGANLYVYCGNNSTNYIDIYGMASIADSIDLWQMIDYYESKSRREESPWLYESSFAEYDFYNEPTKLGGRRKIKKGINEDIFDPNYRSNLDEINNTIFDALLGAIYSPYGLCSTIYDLWNAFSSMNSDDLWNLHHVEQWNIGGQSYTVRYWVPDPFVFQGWQGRLYKNPFHQIRDMMDYEKARRDIYNE